MIARENTRVVADLTAAELEEWLNWSQLHGHEGEEGSRLICFNSLLRSVPKKNLPSI